MTHAGSSDCGWLPRAPLSTDYLSSSTTSDDKDRFLRASNLVELQKTMSKVKSKESVLRQSSAYDEMIGLSSDHGSNTMEIPISDNKLYWQMYFVNVLR